MWCHNARIESGNRELKQSFTNVRESHNAAGRVSIADKQCHNTRIESENVSSRSHSPMLGICTCRMWITDMRCHNTRIESGSRNVKQSFTNARHSHWQNVDCRHTTPCHQDRKRKPQAKAIIHQCYGFTPYRTWIVDMRFHSTRIESGSRDTK